MPSTCVCGGVVLANAKLARPSDALKSAGNVCNIQHSIREGQRFKCNSCLLMKFVKAPLLVDLANFLKENRYVCP